MLRTVLVPKIRSNLSVNRCVGDFLTSACSTSATTRQGLSRSTYE